MAKRNRKSTPDSSPGRDVPPATSAAVDPAADRVLPAPPAARKVATALIVFHFAALLLALAANLAPSNLQGRLTRGLAFYTVTTNQDYGAVPLELSHAEAIDFPLIVQIQREGDAAGQWQRAQLPNVVEGENAKANMRWSRWPNLARLIRLIVLEQPESEILSDIAASFVIASESQQRDKVQAIRFIAPKVLSFNEDAIIAAGQAPLLDDELTPEILYSAQVVHESDQRVRLVPKQVSMRTSKPSVSGSQP